MTRLLLLTLALLGTSAFAQPADHLVTHVDCQGYIAGCDEDFFQTELDFARFVRDPSDAAVTVRLVSEDTGGGGERVTLLFEGRRGSLRGRRDTLVTSTPAGASQDAQRRALLSRLGLGLVGFAGRTGLADRLSVAYDAPSAETEEAAPASDPWNSWVFQTSAQGFFDGQSQIASSSMYGSFSASRVTEAFKVSITPYANYNRTSFELPREDGTDSTIVSDNGSYGIGFDAVKSLDAHWSAGARASLYRNTFPNIDASASVGPALEYNLYSFAESTQRQLRFSYSPGVRVVAYQDTTLFLKTQEVLGQHQLAVAAEFAQPWGSVDVNASAFQYLAADRFDKYRLTLGGGVDLRVVRGLSVRLDGRYSFVRDQIGLRASDATDGEILTRQFELATGYSYYASVGLSYSFGSIFNQVVNPRLD